METEKTRLLHIREMAEEVGMKVATLRTWCNRGLVDVVRMSGDERHIPETEIEKIKKMQDHLKSGRAKTLEKAAEMLEKDDIYIETKSNDEKKELADFVSESLEKNFLGAFNLIGKEFQEMKKENEALREENRKILKLLEEMKPMMLESAAARAEETTLTDSLREELEIEKKRIAELQKQNDHIEKLYQEEKEKNEGSFFSRMFGKKK